MLHKVLAGAEALSGLAEGEAEPILLHLLASAARVARVHLEASVVEVLLGVGQVVVAVVRVEAVALHERLAHADHGRHVHLLLAAVLLAELLPGLSRGGNLLAQVLLLLAHGAFVDLVGDGALEALGERAGGQVALVVLVVGLALLVDLLAEVLAHRGEVLVHGHVLLDPLVVDDGHDLLLNLEHRDRGLVGFHDLVHVLVEARALEREGAGVADVHADDVLVEAHGHEVEAGLVRAALGREAGDDLAVLGHFHLQLAGVALGDGMRVGFHVGLVVAGQLADLLVDGLFVRLERLGVELDGAVVAQLVGGLGHHVEHELEGLAALDHVAGLRHGRERGDDVVLVERGRDEHLDGRVGDGGIEVADAQLLGDDLLRGLPLLRMDAHLPAEHLARLVERIGDIGGRRRDVEPDVAVVLLLLHYLHRYSPPLVGCERKEVL